jgi:hypothetical protein
MRHDSPSPGTRLGRAILVALGIWLVAPVAARAEMLLVNGSLLASDGAEGDHLSQAVAVSGDVLVTTAPFARIGDVPTGAAYVFLRDPATGAWVERKKLMPPDGAAFDKFGTAVAVAGDTVAIGAPWADIAGVREQGAVYVFERDAGGADNWGEVAKLTDAGVGGSGDLGAAVALAGDLLAVGAPNADHLQGRVLLFARDRGGADAWGKVATIKVTDVGGTGAGDGSRVAEFGGAIALDGDRLLVGAEGADISYDNEDDGAAYLFARDPADRDRWTYAARLVAHEAALCFGGRFLTELTQESAEVERCAHEDSASDDDSFGAAVALAGDTAVVGASNAEGADGSRAVGAAYVFQHDATAPDQQWRETAKLAPGGAEGSAFAGFGSAVALAGESLLVGAGPQTIGPKSFQGAAYVFARDSGGTGAWSEAEQLIAADGLSGHQFGAAVAFDGAAWVVGAPGHDHSRGAAYRQEPPGPPPPAATCQPAFAPTGELTNAGVIPGPSGTLLGAVEGALTAPLPVWLDEVPAPAEPLFDGALPRGAYYNAGAQCTTFTPQDAPFALALPVPEGADPSRLGVAVLTPARYLLDGATDGVFWRPVSGVYDPDRRLYLVPLAALLAEGSTFVLVEHPDLGPATAAGRAKLPRAAGETTPAFVVRCSEEGRSAGCGADQVQAVVDGLAEGYVVYQHQGFPPPALVFHYLFLDSNGLFGVSVDASGYTETLIRSGTESICAKRGANVRGFYSPIDENITICLPISGTMTADALRGDARHELFHAVQFAYPKVDLGPWDDWVVEGTAEAAVSSDTEMHRTSIQGFDRELREVDVPLGNQLRDDPPGAGYTYEAQDFWVYLLHSGDRNAHLGTLASFFQLGASTGSVADRLGSNDQSLLLFRSLGEEYWAWVKNQVMEKTVPLESLPSPGNKLANPCQLERALLGRTETSPADISWPASNEAVVSLLHLQAKLVKIEVTESSGFVTVLAESGGGPGGLAYKVYLKGEADCANPAVVPEGSRTFSSLPKGAVIYVVLADTEYEGPVRPLFRVLVTGPEG